MAPAAPVQAAPAAAAPAPAVATDQPPAGAVTSPMVGTAYTAAEPGAAAYVKVGDRIAKGQTLLIIEAMKVMNPIAAPHGGTVTEIYVQDGRPVEYGEVLMVIQ
jgi:acetyl-CoA carboxylase biotin carboxyl carrier protein